MARLLKIAVLVGLAGLILLTGCSKSGQGGDIVIPPGTLVQFSTSEFLKYADTNYQVKLRKVTGNTTLSDLADMTPNSTALNGKTTNFSYIVPKTSTLSGVMVVDILSKSNGLNWKAFVLDINSVIQPTVENTLLYDLVSTYDQKDLSTYAISDLKDLLTYIQTFSAARQDLYGVTGTLPPDDLYRFLRNGLSSDLIFLGKLKDLGMIFDYDAAGTVRSAPYPFGRKNNQPLVDDARTTTPGTVGALEAIRTDIKVEARDPDGDRLFFYFQFMLDGSIVKDSQIWSWTPDYSAAINGLTSPYYLKAFLSDGSMIPIELDWTIQVADNNRQPKMTANCPVSVSEGSTWVCDITGADPDPDDVIQYLFATFNFPYGQPLVNGAPYVPGSRINSRNLHIEWTPLNRDFLKSSPLMVMQLVLSDYSPTLVKKNGDDVKVFTLQMIGKNKAPYPVNGPAGVLNWNTPLTDSPRVLDTKFYQSPPGTFLPYDADTRTPNKKFYFQVVLVDDDNTVTGDPAEYDQTTLRVNSGGDIIHGDPDDTNNFTLEIRTINGQSRPVTVFHYWWQPTAINPSVTASFTPFDDASPANQGTDFQITINADPRSALPTCTAYPDPSSGVNVSFAFTSQLGYVKCPTPVAALATMTLASATDAATLLPQITTQAGGKQVVFTRPVGSANYVRTEQAFGTELAFNFAYQAPAAGAVRFTRSALCDATHLPTTTITIPAGTQLKTAFVASPYQPRITYQTAVVATLGLLDCAAIVPVTTVTSNRTAAINALNKIAPMTAAMTAAGLTVKNTAAVYYENAPSVTFPSVVFTRLSTAAPLTIPAQTTVRSNESATVDSIVYVVPRDLTMAIGQATITVALGRDFDAPTGSPIQNLLTYFDDTTHRLTSRVPAGVASGLTWVTVGALAAQLTLDNPTPLMPRAKFSIETYKNLPGPTQFSAVYSFADGTLPLANEINLMVAPGLEPGTETPAATSARTQAGFSNILVRNPAWTDPSQGQLEFYPSAAVANVSIPTGLVVSTLDRKLYQTVGSGNVIGSASLFVTAVRVYESTYRPASIPQTYTFTDNNQQIAFRNFPTNSTNVPSGQESAIQIEASDNANAPFDPIDPFDRYYVQEYKSSGAAPMTAAQIKMCRESSGACTPCNQTPASPPPASDPYTTLNLGTLSHEDSRFCYFRVTPAAGDVATAFKYNINVCDYGRVGIKTDSCTAQDLQFYVLENNTQPYFTSAHTIPLPPGVPVHGAALGSPVAASLGSATSTTYNSITFNEGQGGTFTVYAFDADKDINNKTLSFQILPKVYNLFPGDGSPTRNTPSGLTISPSTVINTPGAGGVGSLAQAKVTWTPTDTDAKIFSGTQGFIFGIKVYDNSSNPVASKSQTIYYVAHLVNFNNTPSIGPIGLAANNNSYKIKADTYFKQTFTVSDLDVALPLSQAFQTMLSACWNADGSRNANSFFDLGNNNPDICHLSGPEWSSTSYDPAYTGNTAIPQCRIGAGLNVDLAAPKITRTAGALTVVGNTVQGTFSIEWCPQKVHIGSYALGLQVFDNGDMDVNGNLLARKGGFTPLNLQVISAVFLTSPQMDSTGTTELKGLRQTAAAISNAPFTYQVLANNSQNHLLHYTITAAPASCGTGSSSCIDPNTGLITWVPARAEITDGTPATNQKLVISVTDTVTGDVATGTLSLWVQDPTIYPYEQGPSILSATPTTASTLTVKELATQTLTVTAYDANINSPVNDDKLFARLYVDGVVTDDAEMTRVGATTNWTVTFNYIPKIGDGSVDLDGPGPLLNGQHKLKVEVTDGNYTDSKSWLAAVQNNVPSPLLLLDMPAQRRAIEPTYTFSNFLWGSEVAASSNLGGQKYESVYFSGSYVRASSTINYLWALDLLNGVVTKTGAGGKWNYTEALNWSPITQRVAYKTNAVTGVNDIFLTNQSGKYGTFSNITNALKVNGDLTALKAPLSATYACSSGCAANLYLDPGYGPFLSVIYNANRNFYASGTALYWDSNPNGPGNLVPSWPAGYTVAGITVNPATKRLYVSATKSTMTENKVLIYDITPTTNATPSNPVLLTTLDVSAQAGWTIQAPSMPGDIAVDYANPGGRTTYRVFVFLRGTGGIATFTDNGAVISAVSTIGVGSLPSSASDVLGTGSKLAYNPQSDLLWGTSKEARVIFSLDPVSQQTVTKPLPTPVDGIWFLPSGTPFLIDRSNSRIYLGQ